MPRESIRLYDVGTWRERARLDAAAFAFSPDGSRLVTTGSTGTSIWDVRSAEHPARLGNVDTLAGQQMALTPDGSTLVTLVGTTVHLQNLDTQAGTTIGSEDASAFALSPDGSSIAIVGVNAVRIWQVATGLPEITLPVDVALQPAIAYSPDGASLAVGTFDGRVLVWDLASADARPSALEERACSIAGRDLSTDEWARYLGDEPYHGTCPAFAAPTP